MALAIDVRLREGRYDASSVRGADIAEWPPHPARLFCALVAAAGDGDRQVLRWLEQQPPPQVWAPETIEELVTNGFVVTNRTETKGGSQFWPGRTSVERRRAAAIPAEGEFAFVWPDTDAAPDVVEALGDLAWRVPYLGRATTSVAMRAHTSPKPRNSWQVWRPTSLDATSDAELRVPYRGYVDALDAAFEEDRRAWEEARTVAYALDHPTPSPASSGVRGPFERLMVLRFPPRAVRPDGGELLVMTQTLRQLVLSRIGDEAAPQITGHANDGQRHVAYLGLVDAAHEHARGHLVGVALGVPNDLSPEASAQLHTAIAAPGEHTLLLPGGHEVPVTFEPWPTTPNRMRHTFWTGGQAGVRRWSTVTPVMLDRFTRRDTDLRPHIAQSLVTAGYPEPSGVVVSHAPLVAGGLRYPTKGTFPPNRPRRRLVHARVVFDTPVKGPVLAGSMRYLGLGLFAPQFDTDGEVDQ
ncbi:CRISPR-associated protein Csb2 [Lipingzhangella halophila]|uniref:CRISPR-associated protein Csb2 n=1 Tax=Lipingzhangella halophila TaxID=1783352 RepID=A0A7W7RG53_9ACTN|nr:type I-U CRISPR-associated protein Csb2 [Lipingzhangella halophila]MBB4931374.1 CRISPR-associated protein Csb2 [Lipingzhangella halophila]